MIAAGQLSTAPMAALPGSRAASWRRWNLGPASPGRTAELPPFVEAIVVSLFVFFKILSPTMWLQFRRVGRWASYRFGERIDFVLSLVAKSMLAWQVFAGTLAG